MSFTLKILVGLFLGVALGLFLGDIAAPFNTVGDVFIGLLQMTVLPYIVVSLISNIGRISWAERRGLLLAGIAVQIVCLSFGAVVLLLIPLAFPEWESASFFSASMVSLPKELDFVSLYIPSNPFGSLADNVVPAAVLFSILLGIGLGGVRDSASVLKGLDVLGDGLNEINKMVVKLTPLGIFAISAGTAGTVSIEEMSRLQAYLVTYTVIALVMSFVVLPLLVTAFTPFRFGEIIAIPRDTLLTIFAVGKVIVVLPQLAENAKQLFRRHDMETEEVDNDADIMMPLAYPFPALGTYIILMFIPFCLWYLGRSMSLGDQLFFQASSLLSSFVAPIIGIPFLLDVMEIPADMMELFVMSTVYTDRIRVVLGGMHLFALTVVAVAIVRGGFRFSLRRLVFALVVSAVTIGVSLVAVRGYLSHAVSGEYHGDRALMDMPWMDRPVPARQYFFDLPAPVELAPGETRLQHIQSRGTVRVGYVPDSLPFAFRKEQGEVVGLDIEMAHHLALDLGVELELVRLEMANMQEHLDSGVIDIVMSGVIVTPQRALKWNYSEAVMDVTIGFLVPDHERKRFTRIDVLRHMPDLQLGVVNSDDSFENYLLAQIPNAHVVRIDSPRAFVRGEMPELDAVVYSAEAGSAWTLIYPHYSMVVPLPRTVMIPLAYPLPYGEPEWQDYVDLWVSLQRKNGTLGLLVEHWIEGGGARREQPRWSIIRDVLEWVE